MNYKLKTYVTGLYETISRVADGHWDIMTLASSLRVLDVARVCSERNELFFLCYA